MKLSNKLIIASACIFLVSAVVFMSGFLKSSTQSPKQTDSTQQEDKITEKISRTESNISVPLEQKEARLSYVIKTDNDKICAYMVYDNKEPLLWNAVSLPPTLTKEERTALEQGIYTDSFEEMCMYFEAYAS